MNELMTALLASELRRLELELLAGGPGHALRWRQELARQAGTRSGRLRTWIGRGLIGMGKRFCAEQEPVDARRGAAL